MIFHYTYVAAYTTSLNAAYKKKVTDTAWSKSAG